MLNICPTSLQAINLTLTLRATEIASKQPSILFLLCSSDPHPESKSATASDTARRENLQGFREGVGNTVTTTSNYSLPGHILPTYLHSEMTTTLLLIDMVRTIFITVKMYVQYL